MKPRVYLETTIISYLTARISRDLVSAAHQQITLDWWDDRRDHYDIFVSQLVIEECAGGDPKMAGERLRLIKELPILTLTEEAVALAESLLREEAIPAGSEADALHVALSAVHGMDYLLTWNCKHLANATMRLMIESACSKSGYRPPVICTPEELIGDEE